MDFMEGGIILDKSTIYAVSILNASLIEIEKIVSLFPE